MPGELTAFVGITDGDWYESLKAIPNLDEANFWQPGGSTSFRALQPGEPFFFKLHSPLNYVVGGGFFAHATRLPVSLVWQAFGEKNGASTLKEMRRRVEQYRKIKPSPTEDYQIGCILIEQLFFFAREDWLLVSDWLPDWKLPTQVGKTYDLTREPGARLWERVMELLGPALQSMPESVGVSIENHARHGKPTLVLPRLGQGSFRVVVTDAYQRRCAITGEKVLPVLEAAHIRPYAEKGEHRVDNGLLLRSDAHTLFDRGYLTVTPEFRIEVSKRLHSDFDNGEEYFAWHGHEIQVPTRSDQRPAREFLQWHNEQRFLG